jgi:CCR4-NOT transcription complex subunit 9
MDIKIPSKRDAAFSGLCQQKDHYPDLALYLWHSVSTIAALIQEIISIYPLLSPPNLTALKANNVCNVLTLLQSLAAHPDTRSSFLNAHIPLFLYPFLNTISKSKSFEYLRLTSLGVIGSLVKADDAQVIKFLLQTEIIPLCLRIMERGSDLSKVVATFILQKIITDNEGLNYICQTPDRFYAVSTVLNTLLGQQIQAPSKRLLKHIIRCYCKLSENSRANIALREKFPQALKDQIIIQNLDEQTRQQYDLLIISLNVAKDTVQEADDGNLKLR